MRLAVWTSAVLLGVLLTALLSPAYAAPAASPNKPKPPAPPSASALYQKNLDVDALYSYSGREFMTEWDDHGRSTTTVVRVSHQAPGDFRFVIGAPTRYRGWIILQVGKEQWTYEPRKNEVLHGGPHIPVSKDVASKFSLLSKNYRLVVSPQPTRVADRKAYELSMIGRTSGRTLHRIWFDPYTGLVLRREDLRPDGSYSWVSYYSDINFRSKFPPNLFSPTLLARGARNPPYMAHMDVPREPTSRLPVAQVPTMLGGAAIVPKRLGRYVLQGAVMLKDGRAPTLELHYSDGLKVLSLSETVRTSKLATMVPGSSPILFSRNMEGRGARRHGFDILNWDTPRLNLTLVGDVSMGALAAYARQVEATKPG